MCIRKRLRHLFIVTALVLFSGCSSSRQSVSDYASPQYGHQTNQDDFSGYAILLEKEAERTRAVNQQKTVTRVKFEDTPEGISRKASRQYFVGNYGEAFKLFLEAAQKGDKLSKYFVAQMYKDGKGVAQNLNNAREWYTQSAQQGDPLAQNNLAVMLTKGEGGDKDLKGAVQWLIKAAELGNSVAQNNLANKYRYGDGTQKDLSLARKWFQLAAAQGYEDARKSLAELDSEEQKAKSKKVTVSKIKKARKKSVDSGQDSEQIFSAAIACLNGKGVPQNYGRALQLFHDAGQKGNSSSAYYLGMMYEKGLGTQKDVKSAYAWYSKAAQNGDALARERMKRIGIQLKYH